MSNRNFAFTLLFLGMLVCVQAGAQTRKSLTVLFSTGQFMGKQTGPYIETYLNVLGNSVRFNSTGYGKYQSSIEVNISFSQNDTIKAFKKYNLLSPETSDTLAERPNFIDVQRFALDPGTYKMDLKISDNFRDNKPFSYSETIEISLTNEASGMSSIVLLDTYKKSDKTTVLTKGNYDLVPIVTNYYHDQINEIKYYAEIYNIGQLVNAGESVIVNVFIESFESNSKVPGFFRFFKESAKPVIPTLANFNIRELPSGNYYLVIEVRNKDNLIIMDRKAFFQRSNPNLQVSLNELQQTEVTGTWVDKITDMDMLSEYIYCLRPISSQLEASVGRNVVKSGEELAMKQFILDFWQKRDQVNSENKWLEYKKEVDIVNSNFSTSNKKGYSTDRGRVYLKYGKPDQRIVYDREPSLYPYEIWQYYSMAQSTPGQRNNRRFIFSNQDLVTNDYMLIHSDAIGEIRDDRWQLRLQRRNNPSRDFDNLNINNHYGSNLEDMMIMTR
jgi:GWxTD domain-containing protein